MSEPETTDRVPRMRRTWHEITESDGGECQMMADYRWACDEIERLRGITRRLLSAFPTAQTREQEDVWQQAYDAL